MQALVATKRHVTHDVKIVFRLPMMGAFFSVQVITELCLYLFIFLCVRESADNAILKRPDSGLGRLVVYVPRATPEAGGAHS